MTLFEQNHSQVTNEMGGSRAPKLSGDNFFRNDTKEFKNEEIVCTDVWSPDTMPRTSILRRSISKNESEEDI